MPEVKTIGKDYTLKELIIFVSSPIATQIIFNLLMSLDDSLFISRFVGTDGLAAFSIIWPMFMVFDAVVMIFNAAAAYCSKLMGAKNDEDAYRAFTTTALVAILFGLFCTIICKFFIEDILRLLGCTEKLWPLCMAQFNVQCWFIGTSYLSRLFTTFYVVAGKPNIATFTTLSSTIINVLFDYIFVGVLDLGMAGTAYANGIGHIFNIVFGLFFFTRKECEVKITKPNYQLKVLIPNIIKLGIPSMATSLAISLNSIIAHRVLLAYSNETALSANSIVNSLQFMFMSGFFGLADSISPLICYAYGEKNVAKLKRVISQFLKISLGLAILIIGLYLIAKKPLVSLYMSYDASDDLINMTYYGLKIAPFAFVFLGISVYTQTIFNSTNQNLIATIISILENVVFSNLTVILMPKIWGLDGYWFTFLITEILTSIVCFIYLKIKKNSFEVIK